MRNSRSEINVIRSQLRINDYLSTSGSLLKKEQKGLKKGVKVESKIEIIKSIDIEL